MKTLFTSLVMIFGLVIIGGGVFSNHLTEQAKSDSAARYLASKAKLDVQSTADCTAGRGPLIYYKGVYCSK